MKELMNGRGATWTTAEWQLAKLMQMQMKINLIRSTSKFFHFNLITWTLPT